MYKALEIKEPKAPLVLVEKEIPSAPPEGLVIKTGAAGICHSDIPIQDGEMKLEDGVIIKMGQFDADFAFPIVMGHEVAGTVYSIGKDNCQGSEDLKVGDRVVVYTFQGCQSCAICREGNHLWCDKRLSRDIGQGANGGYGEYVSVPDRRFVFKLPDTVPLEVGCLFSCSALTAYNAVITAKPAVENWVKMQGFASFLIIGAGGLGLWATQFAKHLLPKETKILVADISEDKLETAKEYGADIIIKWSTDAADMSFMATIPEAIGSKFIEGSVDFVGAPATMRRSMYLGNKGSTHCIIGLFGGATTFPVPLIPVKSMNVVGVYVGSPQQMKDIIQLAATNEIKPPPIEKVTLDDVNGTLERLRKGQIKGRAVITY